MSNWVRPADAMPEQDKDVLVTVMRKGVGGDRPYVTLSRYWVDSFGTVKWLNQRPQWIVAWMPMPEAFSPEDET